MKVATISLLVTITTAAQTLRADDGSASPLYQLAQEYELAVEKFERIVIRVRGIDRADEKLVDRLDDAATRFRTAARIPRHLSRLFYRWREVQKLQTQVEQRIFGKYTPNHTLMYAWDSVLYHHDLFSDELYVHVENPRHVGNVRRVSRSNSWRDRYLSFPPR